MAIDSLVEKYCCTNVGDLVRSQNVATEEALRDALKAARSQAFEEAALVVQAMGQLTQFPVTPDFVARSIRALIEGSCMDNAYKLTEAQRTAIETGIKAMERCGWTHQVPELRSLIAKF